jgi:hypothetical protein
VSYFWFVRKDNNIYFPAALSTEEENPAPMEKMIAGPQKRYEPSGVSLYQKFEDGFAACSLSLARRVVATNI